MYMKQDMSNLEMAELKSLNNLKATNLSLRNELDEIRK